jgi:hypothetical protein
MDVDEVWRQTFQFVNVGTQERGRPGEYSIDSFVIWPRDFLAEMETV